jgi:RNA-directed DNA polymerase
MNEHGKSDGRVVPAKRPNNAGGPAAEAVEGRRPVKGNTDSATRPGRSAGSGVSNGLERVREVARRDKDARFTALLHHVTLERLDAAYRALRPQAAAGTDGVTWASYGQDLEANLEDLHARVRSGAYRARPSRRVYIPKPDGRLRPLGIASLEDKIVQRAVVGVLNAVYETDFLGFSYGFRPGRSPHDALDALAVGVYKKKVNWMLDADIRDFFSKLDQAWLVRFLEHRIADKRVLRLIRKWLAAGVIEDGNWSQTPEGTPQGGSASPLLANVYLHYVLDRWARQWRKRYARGDMIIVRFADDFVVGFQHQGDAEQFLLDLRERFAKFSLELHPDKTRLIEFGRFAASTRAERGLGKPETFDFLGFTHICGKGRSGQFWLRRITIAKRMKTKLAEVYDRLKRGRHRPVPEQGRWLASVLRGHLAYYAVPGNGRAIQAFRYQVTRRWLKALRRRSQRRRLNWQRMARLAQRWLPPADILHPYPRGSLQRSYPRQEPSAVVPHAGICAGGRPKGRSLPQPGTSTSPSCTPSSNASTITSSDGPARNTGGSEPAPNGHEPGWPPSLDVRPTCSPTGCSEHDPAAGQREPCEPRGSRTVRREPGGAIPPGHSPEGLFRGPHQASDYPSDQTGLVVNC